MAYCTQLQTEVDAAVAAMEDRLKEVDGTLSQKAWMSSVSSSETHLATLGK